MLIHDVSVLHSFSLHSGFVSLNFTSEVFNKTFVID